MNDDAVSVFVNAARLRAVPAIHYQMPFALAVHRICRDKESRPEAIAVELGPETVAYLVSWIKELTTDHKSLPVMLGLLAKNHLIRPDDYDRAIRLQIRSRDDFSKLPPELLWQELHYAPEVLMVLTPTDSIIEGIRCAVEYGIPVYGVDLEQSASMEQRGAFIQSTRHEQSLSGYLAGNCGLAANLPSELSDHRREYAMAARLKTILQRHGDVLFTCGLAHWQRIRGLINDPTLRPAMVSDRVKIPEDRFQRVVVDRNMAAQYLDHFPSFAHAWEKVRMIQDHDEPVPDPSMLFQDILRRAYQNYLCDEKQMDSFSEHRSAIMESSRIFERYLKNLTFMEHRQVPSLFLSLTAARETMDRTFLQVLYDTFMDFPWVQPEDYPDYGYLSDTGSKDGSYLLTTQTISKEIYVQMDQRENLEKKENFMKDNKAGPTEEITVFNTFSWLPWDRFVSTLSIKAINVSQRRSTCQPVAIESGILDSIDIKATLRARAHGTSKLFTRERVLGNIPPEEILDGFPVVWIFTEQAPVEDKWSVQMLTTYHLIPHVRDKQRYDNLVGRGYVIPLFGYGHRDNTRYKGKANCDIFSGYTVFHPTCFANWQHAQWLEQTHYKRLPITKKQEFRDMSDQLSVMYRKRYGINLLDHSWATILILCTLAYAENAMTVVTPDGYCIEEVVYRIAEQSNVTVWQTPVNQFTPKERDRLIHCPFVSCTSLEPMSRYPEEAEQAIGESQDSFMEIVPRQITSYGMLI